MKSKRSGALRHQSSMIPGILAGILIGLFLSPPYNRQPAGPSTNGRDVALSTNVDLLAPDEIQALVVKALSRLREQQELTSGEASKAEDHRERTAYGSRDIELGVGNIRRLLPSARRWTIEALQEAAVAPKASDWQAVTRLINGVRKIVRSSIVHGMAAVRDDRLSEILIDPSYAPYLTSDDETIFVLAHELTHVAARSGKLARFIEGVADHAKRAANVEPTEDQKEDLACDFVAALVLKRFVARTATNESASTRISRVFGYESPAERFARAWQDFCASYNGDPGDEDHLTQYQTIRALLVLDPQLQSMMSYPPASTPSSLGVCR